MSALSKLESLPTEVLEKIFLGSANRNLLLAAPRIAVKLSGNETLYRATFALAFYNHQLRDVLDSLRILSLMPDIETPLKIWDLRSVTKAVLRSRWCTCRWVRTLIDVFAENFLFFASNRSLEDLGHQKRKHLLEDRARFLQCPIWSIDNELYEKVSGDLNEDKPLRLLLESSLKGLDQCQFQSSRMWPSLESVDFANGDGAWADDVTPSEWLRACISSDYYLYPEDCPFKIPPSVFRRAAIQDINYDLCQRIRSVESNELLYVAHLFDVDPYSLPRNDPILLQWAAWLKLDLDHYRSSWDTSRTRLLNPSTDGGIYPLERHNRIRSTRIYQMHLKVLRYIKTGHLEPGSGERSFDLIELLAPVEDSRIKERRVTDAQPGSDEDLISRGAMPPSPADLSFLLPSEYADADTKSVHFEGYLQRNPPVELWPLDGSVHTCQLLLEPADLQNFNLDFSTLEDNEILEQFDFDSFLNTNENFFNFDQFVTDADISTVVEDAPQWHVPVFTSYYITLSSI